jgi:hypothetical protein
MTKPREMWGTVWRAAGVVSDTGQLVRAAVRGLAYDLAVGTADAHHPAQIKKPPVGGSHHLEGYLVFL